MKVKSESEVAQSCPTLSDPIDCSLRLLRPWEFPGKSTGVGCHCLLSKKALCYYNIWSEVESQKDVSGNERRWMGSQKANHEGFTYQEMEFIPLSGKKVQTNKGF